MPSSSNSAIAAVVADLERQIPLDVLPPVATAKPVAALIGVSEGALAQDRYRGIGIPFTKIANRVRYLRSDVLAFLAANRTTQTGAA